jgi:hypothetical protein
MLKKTVVSLVIGASLLGGVVAVGTAYAATPTSTTATSSTTATHTARAWLRSHRKEIRKAGIAVSAKTIGVTPKVLVSDLRADKSVADVASEHGVSTATVVTALVKDADAKVSQAETDHKLTAAQATKIEALLPARITKAVDRTH